MLLVHRDLTLPPLAWVARISPDGGVVARVGNWVDVGDDFIVEGAWAEPFAEGGFAASCSLTGSGLISTRDGVVLSSPCHTTEAIYTISVQDAIYASNSIPGVLVASNSQLDPFYLDYEADALSISLGLDRYKAVRPLAGGRQLCVHYYCNLRLRNGVIARESKPTPPPMVSYDAYRGFLSEQVGGVLRNAAHPNRRRQFAPIVFCSSGYDSTACAVLGKEFGCDEGLAVSSRTAGDADSGRQVLKALGYRKVHKKQETDFMATEGAHLLSGTGELGTSAYFLVCADELRGKVLLSGVHGDKMWDRNYLEGSGTIVRSPYPDTSRTEFRLHVGYLNFPPAFLTATRQEDLHRIANSPEMRPWCMDNDYDRPVPRRIVEEAGVPRELFGVHAGGDAGASFRFGTIHYLARTMPRRSHQQFRNYLKKTERRPLSLMWPLRAGSYSVFALAMFLSLRGHPFLFRALRVAAWPRHLTCSPFAPSRLFNWAVNELSVTSYAGARILA